MLFRFSNLVRTVSVRVAFLLLLITSASVTTAQAQTDGVAAAYGFGEATGFTTADTSGNGNTATLLNGPTWTSAGRFGRGLTFDGVDDTIQLPATETVALSTGFTFEAWIAPTNLFATGSRKLWSHPSLALLVTSQGYLYAIGNLTGGYRAFYSTTTIPVNMWSHVAYTYDGVALRLYINGTEVGSSAVTGTVPASVNAMTLGGPYSDGIAATLDEVRLYRRALSPTEILADNEAAIDCAYTLSPLSISAPFGGISGAVAVTASAGCAWTPTFSASWITGVADGSHVNYTVAPNTSRSIRSATISIASQAVVVVTQAAMPSCGRSATATDRFERRHRERNRRHDDDDDDDDDDGCNTRTAVSDAAWLTFVTPIVDQWTGYIQRLLAEWRLAY